MWSKAPAVKEKPKHTSKNSKAAAAAPAVDADAALRSAQQVRRPRVTVASAYPCTAALPYAQMLCWLMLMPPNATATPGLCQSYWLSSQVLSRVDTRLLHDYQPLQVKKNDGMRCCVS